MEQITNKTKNIKIYLYVVKMIDIIMKMKWYSIKDKDTWTLIYFVNYTFDLHDVFVGSYISQRLVQTAKNILLDLKTSRPNNNFE